MAFERTRRDILKTGAALTGIQSPIAWCQDGDSSAARFQSAARDMAVKNRDKYAKAKKQFSPKYWAEITQEEATEAIKVFVPDYQGATIEVLDLATKTSPGATGTTLLDGIESSAKLLAAKTRISGVVYTRMRIRTDGDYAYRRDARSNVQLTATTATRRKQW